MYYEFKEGDTVKFKKITKGRGSCEVYSSSGVIQRIDGEGNAYVKEAGETPKPGTYVVPLINIEEADL